ncbi:PucR family transcriptional regulator ligand-binding domain-containing protein [Wukongibacter baidiensis]|uniref:PucR family transcriptional regulator n=1 Tax=Wukongibacter baidiensis TaxID=1723361 RepID=UPI003D7F408B
MAVTVRDTLNLPIFRDVKILAGESGLDNEITRVNFIEMPSNPISDEKLTEPGEFKITGFFAYKDNVTKLAKEFESLVSERSSGICLIDEYFQQLPIDIINYANKSGLPILLISKNISYADIITGIMELIIKSKDDKILEGIVDNILNSNKSQIEIRKLAREINYSFNEFVVTIYFSTFDKKKINIDFLDPIVKKEVGWSVVKYKRGILLILTFKDSVEVNIKEKISLAMDLIKRNLVRYLIGVSDIYTDLGMLDNCINEALLAYNSTNNLNQGIVFYKELGVYKLLFQLKSDRRLRKFRDEIILPLKDYERKNEIELINTAKCFLKNDGNIKKTSVELFLHENTVRYRIDKIKEILNMKKSTISFYVQLCLALKADEILG